MRFTAVQGFSACFPEFDRTPHCPLSRYQSALRPACNESLETGEPARETVSRAGWGPFSRALRAGAASHQDGRDS